MIDELQLTIPRPEDGWFYVKMLSDPETMAYNAPWFPPDGCIPDPESGWLEIQKSWIGKEPERFFAFLQRKRDGAFVGNVNYHYDPETGRYDMGIVVYAPERGKGYGSQGLRLLLDRAFRADGVPCLHNDFETSRGAAYRIHRAAGFRETGTAGGIVHLELTREEYLREQAAEAPQSSSSPFAGLHRNRMMESDRIAFVEVSAQLADDYLVMVNDFENVNRFLGDSRIPFTREQEIRWVQEKLEEKAFVFSMLEKTDGRFIGNIELMDLTDTEGELGIALTGEMQNRGYGTEAILALIRYGRNPLGLKRIFLRTSPQNARAIHVYQRCGFREYDRTEDHVFMEIFL